MHEDVAHAGRVHARGGSGTESQLLALVQLELQRRMNHPLEHPEQSRRERWDHPLALFVDDVQLLMPDDRERVSWIAEHGRTEGIIVILRAESAPPRWSPEVSITDRFDPPLRAAGVEDVTAQVDAIMARLLDRSTKKGPNA